MNNIPEACEAAAGRPPRHEQLLDMLNKVRTVTDHLNDINTRLGVKRSGDKIVGEPPNSVPTPSLPVDTLVNVLDMLPIAVANEVDRLHKALDELGCSLS